MTAAGVSSLTRLQRVRGTLTACARDRWYREFPARLSKPQFNNSSHSYTPPAITRVPRDHPDSSPSSFLRPESHLFNFVEWNSISFAIAHAQAREWRNCSSALQPRACARHSRLASRRLEPVIHGRNADTICPCRFSYRDLLRADRMHHGVTARRARPTARAPARAAALSPSRRFDHCASERRRVNETILRRQSPKIVPNLPLQFGNAFLHLAEAFQFRSESHR